MCDGQYSKEIREYGLFVASDKAGFPRRRTLGSTEDGLWIEDLCHGRAS